MSEDPKRRPLLASTDLPHVLGVRAMVGLIFFEVSGGPYGAEPVVRMAGPMLAVLGFLLVPFIWSVPIALLTAELCSHDAHVGGKIHFVHQMWGPRIGWYNGWFNAVSNLFDVATLPPMALSYAEELVGPLSAEDHWYASFGLVFLAVVLNILGIEVVGNASYILCIAVCAPVLLMCVLGLPRLEVPASPEWGSVRWLSFLSCLMWNTSGFDDAGATAAEIKGPKTVYPRALGLSVSLITLLYILTLSVGTSVQPDASTWHSGTLSAMATSIGGSGLGLAISAAGFFSSVAQLNALLCTTVREVVCMAEQPGQPVPRWLARLHPTRGTPHWGTVLFGLLLTLTLNYKFVDLINATVFFDCISFLLQFLTWLRFRWQLETGETSPSDDGFLMPVGFRAVVLWSIGPVVLCVLVLALTVIEKGGKGLRGVVLAAILGEVMYRINDFRERRLQPSSCES